MKILRVCPAPFHIQTFRSLHHLRDRTFDEQVEILRAENIIMPGGWASAMEDEGVEVLETIYNDRALQARWAAENGCAGLVNSGGNYLLKILKEQVHRFQPDVLFIYAGAFFWLPPRDRRELRSVSLKPLLITGLWGDEIEAGHTYRRYFTGVDHVFVCSSLYKKKFDEAGIPATVIGACFDNTIKYTPARTKKWDFIFSGTTGYGFPDHVGRYEKLVEVMQKTDLQIWAQEPAPPRAGPKEMMLNAMARLPVKALRGIEIFSRYNSVRRAANLSQLLKETELNAMRVLRRSSPHPNARYFDDKQPIKKLFPRRVKGQLVDGTDYFKLIADTKLVLNFHRDEDADIGNIRCFEVTGVGSCLVTDKGEELREFFDIENDIVTFNSVGECVEKVKYLLAHPAELLRIAANGQRATLARHTVAHRCQTILETLQPLVAVQSQRAGSHRRRIVMATYDFEKHPVSYDVSFFLQAAEVFRRMSHAEGVVVNIIRPADMERMPGINAASNAAVDAHGRDFRVFHICIQMSELMRTMAVINTKNRAVGGLSGELSNVEIIDFPGPDVSHHSAYYRLVNENSDLVTGFLASTEAHRYVKAWLDPIAAGRKVLCITLRQYRMDPERNSDLRAWRSFLNRVNPREFAVVILPDTDSLVEFKNSILGEYPCFEPACFDVDLRFALYETAFLNMFVNNGPGTAATLDKKVNYLMFKILVPSVPHCTEEFLRWNGFEIGETPAYATDFQKWVWEDDTEEALWREFSGMVDRISLGSRLHAIAAPEAAARAG